MTKFIAKKLYFILLVTLTFTACATAQDNIGEAATALTDNMKTKLELNESQYKSIYTINHDFLTQAKALKNSGEGKLQKAKALKALGETRDAKIKPLLSSTQYTAYLDMKKENREMIKTRMQEKKAAKKQ
ncbi:hypothetical protein GR160_18715 [Flavobacterium sp. Sd200]|uniref:hypothetical protein n=1 Tax=Flavobacterium sp. Sd200 TaxID=2692211 RepID=UPI00136835BC|nr:hypothetical protein [Flavobacterium sp. Sd200]MXN93265.1 hypothetical protein [Flavobacterium sp. Sd200]